MQAKKAPQSEPESFEEDDDFGDVDEHSFEYVPKTNMMDTNPDLLPDSNHYKNQENVDFMARQRQIIEQSKAMYKENFQNLQMQPKYKPTTEELEQPPSMTIPMMQTEPEYVESRLLKPTAPDNIQRS